VPVREMRRIPSMTVSSPWCCDASVLLPASFERTESLDTNERYALNRMYKDAFSAVLQSRCAVISGSRSRKKHSC
jgi:hypothetical protein